MIINYENKEIEKNMLNGEFGLEKESLRVNEDGYVATTNHPFEQSKNIDRDFSESQIELITDVFNSVSDVCEHLRKLQTKVIEKITLSKADREYLWYFSNPPYIGSDESIRIAEFNGELKTKGEYRKYLAKKYGKKKMLLSGIHFNYSFPESLLKKEYELNLKNTDFTSYKNQVYLSLAWKTAEYSWLIVYLMAASPVVDASYKKGSIGEKLPVKYSSVRCGELGYWNNFVPILSYENIDSYTESIEKYVKNGCISSASELYYPVRLKPSLQNTLSNLRKNGVNHIELRMFDVNPLSDIGIFEEDIHFIQLLLVYLSSLSEMDFSENKQKIAIANMKRAALFNKNLIYIESDGLKEPIDKAAIKLLNDIKRFYQIHNHNEVLKYIDYQIKKLELCNNRYADLIYKRFNNHYVEKGLALSAAYADRISR